MNILPVLLKDGYKVGHIFQYPSDTTMVYSNFTPRKGRDENCDGVIFFGLQYFIEEYLINEFNAGFFDLPKDYVVSTNPSELFEVMMIPTITSFRGELNLFISYLMGARMDRPIDSDQPFTLAALTHTLNAAKYDNVYILDPHSKRSIELIEEARAIDNLYLVLNALEELGSKNVTLVSPDAGAREKTDKLAKLFGLPLIECVKHRDSQTGHLSGFEVVSGDVKGKRCLIVDDICDGGGTFYELGKLLREQGATEVSLAVTHGIFSKGFVPNMDYIFTTNSYKDFEITEFVKNVTVIDCEKLMGVETK